VPAISSPSRVSSVALLYVARFLREHRREPETSP
jgi:hypothetical protein